LKSINWLLLEDCCDDSDGCFESEARIIGEMVGVALWVACIWFIGEGGFVVM
jgi:hypothetical protein